MERMKLTDKKDKTRQVYDEFFKQAMDLLNDHQMPVELVAGTMMAISQRLYRTHLQPAEFEMLMESILNHEEIEPYNVKKVRLN